jgi:hypothetical protein
MAAPVSTVMASWVYSGAMGLGGWSWIASPPTPGRTGNGVIWSPRPGSHDFLVFLIQGQPFGADKAPTRPPNRILVRAYERSRYRCRYHRPHAASAHGGGRPRCAVNAVSQLSRQVVPFPVAADAPCRRDRRSHQRLLLDRWQKAGDFRGDSRVSTWIMGIAYRCGLKALRQRGDEPVEDDNIPEDRIPSTMTRTKIASCATG